MTDTQSMPGGPNYELYQVMATQGYDLLGVSISEFIVRCLQTYTRDQDDASYTSTSMCVPLDDVDSYVDDDPELRRMDINASRSFSSCEPKVGIKDPDAPAVGHLRSLISRDGVEHIHYRSLFPFQEDGFVPEYAGIKVEGNADLSAESGWLLAVIRTKGMEKCQSIFFDGIKLSQDEIARYLELLPLCVIKSAMTASIPAPSDEITFYANYPHMGPSITLSRNTLLGYGLTKFARPDPALDQENEIEDDTIQILDVESLTENVADLIGLSFDGACCHNISDVRRSHRCDRAFATAASKLSRDEMFAYYYALDQIMCEKTRSIATFDEDNANCARLRKWCSTPD